MVEVKGWWEQGLDRSREQLGSRVVGSMSVGGRGQGVQ